MIPLAVNHPHGVRTINSSLFFIYFGDSLGIIYPLKFISLICFRDVLLTEIELYGLLHILRIGILKLVVKDAHRDGNQSGTEKDNRLLFREQ